MLSSRGRLAAHEASARSSSASRVSSAFYRVRTTRNGYLPWERIHIQSFQLDTAQEVRVFLGAPMFVTRRGCLRGDSRYCGDVWR